MVVHPQDYAVGNPTPEPPVKRWRIKTKTPLHIQETQVRMSKRPATARQCPAPPAFDFLQERLSTKVGSTATTSNAATTSRDVDAAHQEAFKKVHVPCADEVAGEDNPLRLFNTTQSRRIQAKPRAEKYDYSKHMQYREGFSTIGNEWQVPKIDPPTQDKETEKLADVRRTVVKGLAAKDTVASCAQLQGSPRSGKRRPSQAMIKRELISTRKMTQDELQAAIEEEMRKDAARRPRFQTTGLRGIPDVFDGAQQAEMERDVKQDEILYKMRCNTQTDLRSKAMTALRREQMRASMRKTLRRNFEQGIREKHPHALTKAEEIIKDEWMAADLRKLKEDKMGPEYQYRGHEDVDSDDEMLHVANLPETWNGTRTKAQEEGGATTRSGHVFGKQKPKRPTTAPNVAAYRQYASKRMVDGMTQDLAAAHPRPIDKLAKKSTDNFGSPLRRPENTRLAAEASRKIMDSMVHIPKRPPAPKLAINDPVTSPPAAAGGQGGGVLDAAPPRSMDAVEIDDGFNNSVFMTQQLAMMDALLGE